MTDEKYSGEERRRWHLKKEVSVGYVLAIVLAAVALVGAYSTLDKRLTQLEAHSIFQKQVDERQDNDALRFQARIDESLRTINNKLDRLVESRAALRH